MAIQKATRKPTGFGVTMAPNPPDQNSVQSRVKGIAAEGSPMRLAAKARAQEDANRRGLGASSLALRGAEAAVLDYALPIAQQDSSQGFQASESALGRDQQIEVQRRDQTFQSGQNEAQRQLAIGQQQSQQAFEDRQRALDNERTLEVQRRDQTFQSGDSQAERQLRIGLQQGDQAFEDRQRAIDRDLQTRIAQWNIDADEQGKAAAMVASLEQSFAQQMAALNGNTEIPAADRKRLEGSMQVERDNRLNLVEQIYNIEIAFDGAPDPNWISAPPKSPVPKSSFDDARYLRENPSVAADPGYSKNPYSHYTRYGGAERQYIP